MPYMIGPVSTSAQLECFRILSGYSKLHDNLVSRPLFCPHGSIEACAT